MGRKQDADVEQSGPPEAEPSTREPPGRVEVDSRGHNVWRWTRDANDSTSVVLKRLDNENLALEPTQKVPVVRPAPGTAKGTEPAGAPVRGAPPKGAPAKNKKPASDAQNSKDAAFHAALPPSRRRDSGGGFDPYNSSR